MRKTSYYALVIITGFFFLFYIGNRADKLSMTHDESSTTNVVDGTYRDIMFAPSMFGSANNHVVNSLLLKKSVQVFGWHEWSVRLPNVLAFIVYFIAIVFLMGKLSSNTWTRLAGIFFLCASHYILDYFSLARGYGLAVAFEMASLYFFIQFFVSRKADCLLYSFLFAALAAYSNFTWLNLFLAQWLVLNLIVLSERKGEAAAIFLKKLLKLNSSPLLVALTLTALIYKPISYLRRNDEFKWGSDSWLASFHSFVSNLHYSRSDYFLNYDIRIFLLKTVVVFTFVAGGYLLGRSFLRNRRHEIKAFPFYSLLISVSLISILIVSTVLQRYLLNTFYVDGRKALFYVPVLLILFASLTRWIGHWYPSSEKTIWFLAYTTGLIHLMSIFNFYSCNEWWYDASSKRAYQYIVSDTSSQPKTTAVNWMFSQSMTFYNKRMYNNSIPLLKNTNELPDYEGINYVYVIGDEIRNIPPVFIPVKRYLWDRFLLKRDPLAYDLALKSQLRQQQLINSTQQLPMDLLLKQADSALHQQRQSLNWSQLLYSE